MTIGQPLTKKPITAIAVSLALILTAAYCIYRQIAPEPLADTRLFFTTDDGATWFHDDQSNIPPYDHNGKQAVRCFLFKSNSQTFVGYLRKYSDPVRKKLIDNTLFPSAELTYGTLVKKPGDKRWIPLSDPRSAQIMSPTSPTDPTAAVIPIEN